MKRTQADHSVPPKLIVKGTQQYAKMLHLNQSSGPNFCLLCQDGGMLFEYKNCLRTINVYTKGFTVSGWPVLPSYLKVKGCFKLGMVGQILCPAILLLDIHFVEVDIKTHVAMIYATLQDFYPTDGLYLMSIPFSLEINNAVTNWPTVVACHLKTLTLSYQQVVAVVTNHTDEATSDIFLGTNKTGKGHTAEVDQVQFKTTILALKSTLNKSLQQPDTWRVKGFIPGSTKATFKAGRVEISIIHPEMWIVNSDTTQQLIRCLKSPLPTWSTIYAGLDDHNAKLKLDDLEAEFEYPPETGL
ncbi:hypothetical protein HD554DRAFT_2040649 [Boletus coccyginus]|nr:hypothetical protein HD554DRAFT_2040649 [Boletus coccyginus]